jgi:hypothetical protein
MLNIVYRVVLVTAILNRLDQLQSSWLVRRYIGNPDWRFSWFRSVILGKWPITIAARSKAWTVFARSDAGIVGSNPTQGIDVWCVYAFILCLCCHVFRLRLCDGLITRLRSSTVCEKWLRNWTRGQGTEWTGRAIEKNIFPILLFLLYLSFFFITLSE